MEVPWNLNLNKLVGRKSNIITKMSAASEKLDQKNISQDEPTIQSVFSVSITSPANNNQVITLGKQESKSIRLPGDSTLEAEA